jgi:opacity protein-like surface antigen
VSVKTVAGAVAVLAVSAVLCGAQTREGAYTWRLGCALENLSVAVDARGSDWDYSVLSLGPQLDGCYFFGNRFSLGASLRPVLNTYDQTGEGDSSQTGVSFLIRPDFYFKVDRSVVPYAGLRLGLVHQASEEFGREDSHTALAGGVHAGLKFYVSEQISWDVEGDATLYAWSGDDYDASATAVSLLVALCWCL